MLSKPMAVAALWGTMLVISGCATNDEVQVGSEKPVAAPQTVEAKATGAAGDTSEVAFPKLPAGAGKIDEKAPKAFTTTSSGLKYRILREGAGTKPTASQSVNANYHGWLDNEKVFDSSYGDTPISFPLNGVIAGWTEGMQLVGEGGMIELEIPGDLAYGPGGRPGIPPNATLHFVVELIDVE